MNFWTKNEDFEQCDMESLFKIERLAVFREVSASPELMISRREKTHLLSELVYSYGKKIDMCQILASADKVFENPRKLSLEHKMRRFFVFTCNLQVLFIGVETCES